MNIGKQIAFYRKKLNITQDILAQKLDVTNQAVSKWENDQCYPDIALLPKLADIFECSIDALFARDGIAPSISTLPWPDDEKLRVVVYHGRSLVADSEEAKNLSFQYEGPALNIDCALNVQCEAVSGNIHAGGSVTCDCVEGNINAGGSVTCDIIEGDVRAGGNITCDEICGSANAGGNIYCDEINMEDSKKSDHVHLPKEDTKTKGSFSFFFRKK